MASQAEEPTISQDETVEPTAGDYPKVEGRSGPSQEAAPIGSRPLSVSQTELSHHPGADPDAKQEEPEEVS